MKDWSGSDLDPVISSLTVNWRGIIAPPTVRLLVGLGIPRYRLSVLVARALGGSMAVYANYMGTSGGGDVT